MAMPLEDKELANDLMNGINSTCGINPNGLQLTSKIFAMSP